MGETGVIAVGDFLVITWLVVLLLKALIVLMMKRFCRGRLSVAVLITGLV